MKLPSVNTKLAVAGAVIILGGAAGTAALISQPTSATDTTPTEQQVDKNTSELANHEARITNTENDVKVLQDKTETPPSSQSVSAPSPVKKAVVTDYEFIYASDDEVDCKYTYSDGSTLQFVLSRRNAQGAWETNGYCSNRVLGSEKP